ncbi:MAG: formylglycine-generating enzyme family protein [Thermodesulfobacteriota bacterium]|nr:formylglycine-generating enzyme family protein [Thermodesulfobacteriota bacterium]
MDGAEMILIPAGEFLMGSVEEVGRENEHPQHTIYLDAYYIYKYPVTNEQFARFVDKTGYRFEGNWKKYSKLSFLERNILNAFSFSNNLVSQTRSPERHPVICITWNDAMAYCMWVRGDLPTEAQWEKAARGTDGREYPWGNEWDGTKCNWKNGTKMVGMADISNWRGTTPTGSYPSGVSPYGVYDMAGNVNEWCADWYGESYYGESPSKNPKGPLLGDSRVFRGGSWSNENEVRFRCSFRIGRNPCGWLSNIGFRVCLPSSIP